MSRHIRPRHTLCSTLYQIAIDNRVDVELMGADYNARDAQDLDPTCDHVVFPWDGGNWRGIRFDRVDTEGIDFSGADLSGTVWLDCDVQWDATANYDLSLIHI